METVKENIKNSIKEILVDCFNNIESKIDEALDCGALDFENDYDPIHCKYYLAKVVVGALLENQAEQMSLSGSGTGKERKIKKDKKNLKYFL